MSSPTYAAIWAVALGMGVVNFALRYTPVAVFSRRRIPAPLMRWLSFVPISVMGSLVALEVLRPAGSWRFPITSPYLWAAIVTGATFKFTKSFLGATLAGMGSFVLIRWMLGA